MRVTGGTVVSVMKGRQNHVVMLETDLTEAIVSVGFLSLAMLLSLRGPRQPDEHWSCFKGNVDEPQGGGMEPT